MINFKFLKIQLKSSIWITLSIALIPILFSIFFMSFVSFAWRTTIIEGTVIIHKSGAINMLGVSNLFGPIGETLAIIFAVTLAIKLISVEISKNYMSSWLTLPMSRQTIFLTKIFSIFLSSLIIVLSNLFVEFIIVAIKQFPDFGKFESWILIKLNLGLLLIFLLITAIAVFFATFFNRTSYAITLSIVIPSGFLVFFLAGYYGTLFNLSFLSFLKYLTFFSLFDFKQLIQYGNNNFIWKFILMVIFLISIFITTNFYFKKRIFNNAYCNRFFIYFSSN